MKLANNQSWLVALVVLAIQLMVTGGHGSALIAVKVVDLNGNNLATDSFDSADPNYSMNGLYPFQNLSKTTARGDVVVIGSGLTNSLSPGNARIKGSLRVGAAGTNFIGATGSVGDKDWVDGGSP